MSENTVRRRYRRLMLGAVVLLLAFAAYLGTTIIVDRIETDQAAVTADEGKSLADQVAEVCAAGGVAATQLGSACDQAAQVQDLPAPDVAPADGSDGRDGRGVTVTAVVGGRLMVSYTDGTTEDKGRVAGADGDDGATGADGKDGRGITTSRVIDGALVLTYTDGVSESLGPVVGPAGRRGEQGRGIASTGAVDGRLVVTYTDGTTADVGPLPQGPAGEQGAQGEQGPPGPTCPQGYSAQSRTVTSQTLPPVTETWWVCVADVDNGG